MSIVLHLVLHTHNLSQKKYYWSAEPIVSSLGPLYWLYFTSFIVIGTFIIINHFISVIVRKSEEAYKQVQQESAIPITQQDVMHDIKEIRRILEDLKGIGEDKRELKFDISNLYAKSTLIWVKYQLLGFKVKNRIRSNAGYSW